MDSGNSFDSSNIKATFATPFIPLNDAELRKTIYKLHLYTEPTGSFETNASLKFDLNEQRSVQPEAIALSNTAAGLAGVYGKITSTYGTAVLNFCLLRLLFPEFVKFDNLANCLVVS